MGFFPSKLAVDSLERNVGAYETAQQNDQNGGVFLIILAYRSCLISPEIS